MSAQPRSAPGPSEPQWTRTGTSDPNPVVAVHTWAHETTHYEALSEAMGGAGIVSLLPPSPDSGALPRRVEQWVDHAEAVLRDAPVEPPFRFVGWSFGGVVAVELARRLRSRSDDVSFVGMIDTTRPRLSPVSDREYIWYHLAAAARMDDDRERLPYLRKRAKFLVYRRFPRTGKAAHEVLQRVGLRSEQTRTSVKPTDPSQVSIHTSYLNYRGAAVPFPVSLYATRRSSERALEPALRWSGWLNGGYELVSVAGEHFTVWGPEHIGTLADALRRSLSRIDGPLV